MRGGIGTVGMNGGCRGGGGGCLLVLKDPSRDCVSCIEMRSF